MAVMKPIIDVCCGGRMFWFDKNNKNVVFMDNRTLKTQLCDGRSFEVNPDVVADFRNIPFPDNTFSLVVFDPPHLLRVGQGAWLAKKYGRLDPDTYKKDLALGFKECFRILKPQGVLVFKWNETDVKTTEIIKLSPIAPLFGHKSGKLNKTQWLVFMK